MNDAIRLRILELRESRNWTQEDLARKLQVNLKNDLSLGEWNLLPVRKQYR